MLIQFLVGGIVSLCNITIHALVMTVVVRVARASGTKKRSHPSLRLIATMIATLSVLESVRNHHDGLQSFRSMSLIEARRRNTSALRLRFSQSFARRRHLPSQANVRSTTHRRGTTSNPFANSDRFTISVLRCGNAFA